MSGFFVDNINFGQWGLRWHGMVASNCAGSLRLRLHQTPDELSVAFSLLARWLQAESDFAARLRSMQDSIVPARVRPIRAHPSIALRVVSFHPTSNGAPVPRSVWRRTHIPSGTIRTAL